jgi:hypothetical protein
LFRQCWKACQCEFEHKATVAKQKEMRAEKIAVLADTTTMKDYCGGAHPAAKSAFRFRPLLLQLLAMQYDKHIELLPDGIVELADLLSRFLCGSSCYHLREQLHLAEFAALESKKLNDALDMELLVRTKPFRDEKQGGFTNDVDSDDDDAREKEETRRLRSEFLGGLDDDDASEVEDTEGGDLLIRRHPVKRLDLDECKALLRRDREVERASAPGRHKEADIQMKGYVSTFRSVFEKDMPTVPAVNVLDKPSLPHNSARSFQNAVAKEARASESTCDRDGNELSLQELLALVRRNEAKEEHNCSLVPLPDQLRGPGHVAWKRIQEVNADPDNNFEFNTEQIEVIALLIWPVEQAWRSHVKDKLDSRATVDTLRKLPNDLGLPRTLVIGGGGCGKTVLMQLVLVPTLELFFEKIVLTAPSNRAARGFHPRAKTMHSIAGMRPQDSMRTSSLHIKSDAMRKRMDANQTKAGAWLHDEAMQTAAPLMHACALRTTYARQHVYNLDTARYAEPSEIFGRISFYGWFGDHLQLPPVPKSSGLLAPLTGTSDEHKVGASMLSRAHYVYEMHTMKRFDDPTLVTILHKMRQTGGAKLTEREWQALSDTGLDKERVEEDPEGFLRETSGWFESSYLWSIVSMASYTRARISAQQHAQTLLYCQAVDVSEQILRRDTDIYDRMLSVPNVGHTSRLPAWVLLHTGMRVRLTTQVLPPWAVQDATGTVMEIDICAHDRRRLHSSGDPHPPAEMCLTELPMGVYVKLDKCNHEFLPPLVCQKHQCAGFCKECCDCRALEGWVLIEPLTRQWTFKDPVTDATLNVKRTQLPLMPEAACALYSLQGATCDPGLVAHFAMPKRADHDIKWLIVYVLLSRVRSLSRLRSIGLTTKIRQIIEGGPPAMLAENFEKVFRQKITHTKKTAQTAVSALGWS